MRCSSSSVEAEAEIDRALLVIHDLEGRKAITQRAAWDDNRAAYHAVLNSDLYPLPVGTPLAFEWCMTDTGGAQVCSDVQHTEIWDPVQSWFRMENEWVKVFWYGFGEDDPENIAAALPWRLKQPIRTGRPPLGAISTTS